MSSLPRSGNIDTLTPMSMATSRAMTFFVNGDLITVDDHNPTALLGDFLRDHLALKGLQLPCRQGGCGACTVVLSSVGTDSDLEAKGKDISTASDRAINACLRPLFLMDGMAVTTVEGVGNLKTGLSAVQKALVQHNGTQCGFCTPGFVMSMHGLLKSNPNPTCQQVEDQLDGNLCRCTGYRPIFDAFQSFSCEEDGKNKPNHFCKVFKQDLEDFSWGHGRRSMKERTQVFSKQGITCFRVHSLTDLYILMDRNKDVNRVKMVVGNTSTGVYPSLEYDICIDISRIPALLKSDVNSAGITIGGAVPIADLMTLLRSNKEVSPSFLPILRHLKRVATPQVRSVGSVAGNLMMAHEHKDFYSDIATILMAAEVKLKISLGYLEHSVKVVTLEEFFMLPTDGMIVLELQLPFLKPSVSFFTYKVALRSINAHAIVNCAFKFEIDNNTGVFLSSPAIVYGGIKSYPQRVKNSAEFLEGRYFKDPQVFNAALKLLQEELIPDSSFGRTEYRSFLIAAYFYKAFLSLWPKELIPPDLLSASAQYVRPISSGKISFGKGDPVEYPVSQPIPKLSAASQVTGDALYLDDLEIGGVLYAEFVLSTAASATIKSIYAGKALMMPGVVAFVSADTVAAEGYCNIVSDYEFVFASGLVEYYGQAVGLIVANSQPRATAAAKLVEVTYEKIQTPILTIDDAIQADSFFADRGLGFQSGSTKNAFNCSGLVVAEGEVGIGHQYHFHLETQRAICIPTENGCMKVYSSTQNPSQVQKCVGAALNRQQHKISVEVKRVGGAYGSKLNRSASIAMACAIAADKVGRPVKLVLDLSTNMQMVGARSPYFCKYKVGAVGNGCITAVEMLIFNNQGAHFDFEYPDMSGLVSFIDNVYSIPNWKIQCKVAKTNLPACTYMRGPVFVEATFMLETAIEHVASILELHPEVVREVNMYTSGDSTLAGQQLVSCNAREIFNSVKATSNYEKRSEEVSCFNSKNRWVKRGLSLVPIKFPAYWEGSQMVSLVNVYPDGSIGIHHSGCEIGQGLDVKVAQVAAMTLGSVTSKGIRMDDIYVHTTTSIIANNVAESGGSVTSELCAMSVQIACQAIVERLDSISTMITTENGKPDWQELIYTALENGVDLQARGRVYPGAGPNGPFQYLSFGAGVTEAEVDLLTGETRILRVDMLLDCGKSLNPAIDLGQMQGAFVQGLGYHFSEEYEFHTETGKLLSDGTWMYKPPSSKDIPIVFNAALLQDSTNPTGFLRSKFSGEPPYGMACSALFAVRKAVAFSRSEKGLNGWCQMSSPATVEKVVLASGLPYSMLNFTEMKT